MDRFKTVHAKSTGLRTTLRLQTELAVQPLL
eukprot:SAG11_NODE_29103_length_314_cov_0.962791_1_plen_30_part_01